jgi:hypothetical protein
MKIVRCDRRSLSGLRHRLDPEPDRPREFNRFFAVGSHAKPANFHFDFSWLFAHLVAPMVEVEPPLFALRSANQGAAAISTNRHGDGPIALCDVVAPSDEVKANEREKGHRGKLAAALHRHAAR